MAHEPIAEHRFPDYDKPPVVEVVCGILFKPVRAFLSPHIGLLWEKYKAEYGRFREVAPLDSRIERFDDEPQASVEISGLPPLPRIWFIQNNDRSVIQVQRDKFLYNWRKVNPQDEYPRYQKVRDAFVKHLLNFEEFLNDYKLGAIEHLQYEMTYVNHIRRGEGWTSLDEIGKVFPDLTYRTGSKRFLPVPSNVNWRTSFVLPDKNGRLHVQIRDVRIRESGQPILIMELIARGIDHNSEKSVDSMAAWFDLARNWIVYGFEDLTSKEIQERVWKKKL